MNLQGLYPTADPCRSLRAIQVRSELWLGGRQFASNNRIGKPARLVGPVAERLIGGVTTAAECYGRPACQTEGAAFGIDDLEVSLDADRAVVVHDDLGCRHLLS